MFIAGIHENIDIVVDKCCHTLVIQRPHGDSWLHPPTYIAVEPRVVLLPRRFFFNFYVSYCIFQGHVYTYRYIFCLGEKEEKIFY